MIDDSTKPRRADVFPEDEIIDENTGPGCLIWSGMGLFASLMAVAIVLAAALAGFNSGLGVAKVTATALRNHNIATQCAILPTDIAAAQTSPDRLQIVQGRFENLAVDGVLPNCAEVFVPQATALYNQSIATATPSPSPSPSPTTMPESTQAVIAEATSAPTSDSPYDLDALLAEAQGYIAEGNFAEAIRTLEAIKAIDTNFQTQTVNGLLFNALKQEALNNFRNPDGSLQEGIILANRAAEYGDIGELAFERDVASLYMDAIVYLDVDYPMAIRLLTQVIALSPSYPRGTGQAGSQLFGQYVAYGDAYVAGMEPCQAVPQYDAALQLRSDAAVTTKRDSAQQACTFGVPATADPNATLDPFAPTATQGIAPVGQGG